MLLQTLRTEEYLSFSSSLSNKGGFAVSREFFRTLNVRKVRQKFPLPR